MEWFIFYYQCMYSTKHLRSLADVYAKERRILLSTLGRLVTGSATFFGRLEEGRVTIRRADAAIQWFSSNWPEGL